MLNISHYQRNANQNLIQLRMAIIKKSTNGKCQRGCGEKGTLLHCWWEWKLIQPLWKTIWRSLKKLEINVLYDPSIPLISHEKTTPMYPSVHGGNIYNNQDMETTQMSIDKLLDKEVVVHLYNGILLSHKKDQFVSCSKVDEPRILYRMKSER